MAIAEPADVLAPAAVRAERLVDWLREQGFADLTIGVYLRWVSWFAGWLADRRIGSSELTDAVAAEFAAAMQAAGREYRRGQALRGFRARPGDR